MKRIVLVNPNTNPATTARMVAIAQEHIASDFVVEGATAGFGSPLITDEDQLHVAAQAVADMAPTLARIGDAVIVSAFGDPGVDALRRLLSVPVVGIAECAMREAGCDGRRFSVVTTTPALVAAISRRADQLGLGRQFLGVRTTAGPAEDLMKADERLFAALKPPPSSPTYCMGRRRFGLSRPVRAAHFLTCHLALPGSGPILAALIHPVRRTRCWAKSLAPWVGRGRPPPPPSQPQPKGGFPPCNSA